MRVAPHHHVPHALPRPGGKVRRCRHCRRLKREPIATIALPPPCSTSNSRKVQQRKRLPRDRLICRKQSLSYSSHHIPWRSTGEEYRLPRYSFRPIAVQTTYKQQRQGCAAHQPEGDESEAQSRPFLLSRQTITTADLHVLRVCEASPDGLVCGRIACIAKAFQGEYHCTHMLCSGRCMTDRRGRLASRMREEAAANTSPGLHVGNFDRGGSRKKGEPTFEASAINRHHDRDDGQPKAKSTQNVAQHDTIQHAHTTNQTSTSRYVRLPSNPPSPASFPKREARAEARVAKWNGVQNRRRYCYKHLFGTTRSHWNGFWQ